MDIIIEILWALLIVLLVFISGVFSFSEISFASFNLIRMKTIANDESKKRRSTKAKKILLLRKKYNETSTSIVILNNIINIIATTLSTGLFVMIIGDNYGMLTSTIVMSFLLIIIGEIIPKIWAKRNPEEGMIFLANLIYAVYWIFSPFTKLITKIAPMKDEVIFQNELELEEALKEVNSAGIIDNSENEIIKNTLKFDKLKIKHVMTKKENVSFIKKDIDEEELDRIIATKGYSRFPVIDEDKIIGIFSVKKYFSEKIINKKKSFEEKFNNSTMKAFIIDDDEVTRIVFDNLKSERQGMGIVQNPLSNEIVGIITIEDLLEELVGEIYDENDIETNGIYQLGINTIQIKYWANCQLVFNEYFKHLDKQPIISKKEVFGKWILNTFNKKNLPIEEFFDKNTYLKYENLLIWVKKTENEILFEVDIVE